MGDSGESAIVCNESFYDNNRAFSWRQFDNRSLPALSSRQSRLHKSEKVCRLLAFLKIDLFLTHTHTRARVYFQCQILLYPVIHMLDFLSPAHQKYYRSYKGAALLNPTGTGANKCVAKNMPRALF